MTRSVKSLITARIITQLHHQERDNFCPCNSEQDTNKRVLLRYLRDSAGTRKFPKEIRNNVVFNNLFFLGNELMCLTFNKGVYYYANTNSKKRSTRMIQIFRSSSKKAIERESSLLPSRFRSCWIKNLCWYGMEQKYWTFFYINMVMLTTMSSHWLNFFYLLV